MRSTSSAPSAPLPAPSRIILTVKQLAQQQPGLTEGGIRWDLFNRESNGLARSGAVVRNGRKVLIDPELYLAWLVGPKPVFAPRRSRGAAV